jgi:hypothetical protein
MKSNVITEIDKIKNLMNVTILNENVVPVPLIRRLVSQYGDDVLKTLKLSGEGVDDILRKIKDPNAQITDDVAEKILQSIDWDSLAKVVMKKVDAENKLPKKYILKMLKEGSNINQLQKSIEKKFIEDAPFNQFPPQLQDAIIDSLYEDIRQILKNKESFNKLLLNLNMEDIVAKISKKDIDLLTKKGFDDFKEMGIDFLNKSDTLFREAQSLIKELSDPKNIKPVEETKALLNLLEEKIKKIQQLDTNLYTNIKRWANLKLDPKKPLENETRQNIDEIFTIYNSSQPVLNNFWSKWGLKQAWETWKTSYRGSIFALKKLKSNPIMSSLDVGFGNSVKEGEKVWEWHRKIMNILIGTRRTLTEYRQLAKQIGVPQAIISYATEAVLLRAIGLSVIITILKFIRDFFGAVFNLGSTKNELYNDFWNQWEAAPKDKSGIIWQLRKYFVMFLESIGEFIKQPGFLLKTAQGAIKITPKVLNLLDKTSKMTKEDFEEARKEVNTTIRAAEEELRNVAQEAASSGTSATQSQIGSFEHFKNVYGSENTSNLGNGLYQRSDGIKFRWNDAEGYFEPQ